MLKYLYALLFSEIHLALLKAGLDPMVGIFHADQYRDSFVYNVMESVRSDVDARLLSFINDHIFWEKNFTRREMVGLD
jgi:CRISPR-associated protein Cas1